MLANLSPRGNTSTILGPRTRRGFRRRRGYSRRPPFNFMGHPPAAIDLQYKRAEIIRGPRTFPARASFPARRLARSHAGLLPGLGTTRP